jgi:cytochrome c heme-lyase
MGPGFLHYVKTKLTVTFRAEGLQLSKFTGKPGQVSPKARLFMFAGRILPSRFRYYSLLYHGSVFSHSGYSSEAPFDRHDWIVKRRKTGEEVRYVIDYYSLPDKPNGTPVFSLDVRPALDSVSSIKERISVAAEETWASFREKQSSTRQETS